jgi:hypothetical protein
MLSLRDRERSTLRAHLAVRHHPRPVRWLETSRSMRFRNRSRTMRAGNPLQPGDYLRYINCPH